MNQPYDFTYLLDLTKPSLFAELATVHSELATLHEEIAFIRAEEANHRTEMKPQRLNDEGHRDALIEKKFLIVRLLDAV